MISGLEIKERRLWLHYIISILRYNYQLVVRAELAIVSILRTARVSVSIKVWRHLKSHLWYPPSPLRVSGRTQPTYFPNSFFFSLNILSDVSSGWTLMMQIACLYSEQISCVLYWYLHQYSLLLRPHLTSRHTLSCPHFLTSLNIKISQSLLHLIPLWAGLITRTAWQPIVSLLQTEFTNDKYWVQQAHSVPGQGRQENVNVTVIRY